MDNGGKKNGCEKGSLRPPIDEADMPKRYVPSLRSTRYELTNSHVSRHCHTNNFFSLATCYSFLSQPVVTISHPISTSSFLFLLNNDSSTPLGILFRTLTLPTTTPNPYTILIATESNRFSTETIRTPSSTLMVFCSP